jgi:type VI secretion system protein ImpL
MMIQVVVAALAMVLVLGTWVAGAFLAWPLWIRVVITVAVVLATVLFFVILALRARAKARALESDLLKQAEQQALAARPDRRGEIMELQLKVKRALEALKQSKLGGKRGGPLYALPWYMIVGPPGAGKTTALSHSGLSFPIAEAQGGIRGVGGTRNCDWWFTNEGILIDTAGRFAIDTEDQQEWLAFLDMLRRSRSRMPLNGVLVATDLPSLLEKSEEEVVAHARRLRARIDEIMARLRVVLPVYLMFTKADLMAGFSEFFDDLRKSERAQIWGATFPLGELAKTDAKTAFEREFDELGRAVFARTIRRLSQERRPEARTRIFHFPLEFRTAQANLAELVGTLFEKNAFRDTPIFRGFYFSSGTQEGRPVDRIVGNMMSAFGVAPPALGATPPLEPKSYFVSDLFRRVVFPDQDYAARSEGERRRQLVVRGLLAAAAAGFALVVVGPGACSFSHNRSLLKQTEDVSAEAAKVRWRDGADAVEKVTHLDDMRAELKQLEAWRDEGAPLEYAWGMYVGNSVYEPLRNVYIRNLFVGFATPTKAKLEDDLRAVTETTALSSEGYNLYFNRLKAYLQACDRERLDVEWESTALTEAWSRALNAPTTKSEKDVLHPHSSHYVELMKKGEVAMWDCDMALVSRIRAYLKRMNLADRDYSALVRDANEFVPPITRQSIFLNSAVDPFVTSKSSPEVVVRGAYTKAGWTLYIRDRLGKGRAAQLMRDRWVLGESEEVGTERTEKQLEELRDRYFANHQRAWADFLKDLEVRRPNSNEEALDELTALSELPWPYQRLVRTIDENTRLEEAPEERARREATSRLGNIVAQAAQTATVGQIQIGAELRDAGVLPAPTVTRRWESPPELAFKPIVAFGLRAEGADAQQHPPLAAYQERIVPKVVAVITDLRDSKGRGVKPEAVTRAFEEAIRGTNELMTPTQTAFTRPLLSPLLLNPLELGYGGVQNDLVGTAGATWENAVWKKWNRDLQDGYPFTDGWRDVKLSDYSAFFRPDGLLFGFSQANLKDQLERVGNRFTPTTRFGQTPSFTGGFMRCLDRGLEISQATFDGEKAEGPSVDFELNLHSVSPNVSEVTVEVDGQSKTYRNGPEQWLAIKWPNTQAKERGSRIKVRGYSGLDEEIIRPGEWGWFRVLDAAKSIEQGTEGGRRGGSPVIVATWSLRSQHGQFKIDVRPARDDNPFIAYVNRKQRLFRGYDCPRVISAGTR